MRGSERVIDKNICQGSQILGEGIFILGLFLAETCVLQKDNVPILHLIHSCADIVIHNNGAGNEFHFLSEKFGEAGGHRRKRLCLFILLCFHLAQMRAEDNFAAVSDQFLNSRKSSNQTVLVRNLSVLERHVEIAADKHALSLYINVIHRFFV